MLCFVLCLLYVLNYFVADMYMCFSNNIFHAAYINPTAPKLPVATLFAVYGYLFCNC